MAETRDLLRLQPLKGALVPGEDSKEDYNLLFLNCFYFRLREKAPK
jgi:hypothetical protein